MDETATVVLIKTLKLVDLCRYFMYVHVYVYMYVCMYVCMYVMYAYIYIYNFRFLKIERNMCIWTRSSVNNHLCNLIILI